MALLGRMAIWGWIFAWSPGLAWTDGEPPVVLFDGGQPRCTIVLPDAAGGTLRRAAADLAAHMGKMAGSPPPIVVEALAPQGPRIDVGRTSRCRAHWPDSFWGAGDEERIVIRAAADGIMLCGGSDRAMLFAAYRFLEHLGCRWLTPEPENQVVPSRPTITVGKLDIDTRPAFSWRMFKARDASMEAWGTKMGFNGFFSLEAAPVNGGCLYWPTNHVGVHQFAKIMPPRRYFAAHPEWYPLVQGQRVPCNADRGQLCVTAPGLADEFAANVAAEFGDDPACRLMSISPNDGYGWCECEACTGLDQRLCGGRTTAQGLGSTKPFMGDRVFWFANEVARRVGIKFPDRRLLVLAYVNYAEPPDTIRPLPAVVPFLCHYAPADYSRPIGDPASEPNRLFDGLLRRWVKIAPDLMIYSYVSKSMWWRLPRPILRPFVADIRHYRALGVHRYYCQSGLNDWALDGPLYYVIGKMLWDPNADPDAVATEWVSGMFGPAAEAMGEFYRAVDASVQSTGKAYSDNPKRDVPGLFERDHLDRAMAALDRAEAVADGPFAARVAAVAKTFRYGYRMIAAIELHHRFVGKGEPDDLRAAGDAGRKAMGYYKDADAKKFVASLDIFTDMGVMAKGFGEPQELGGRRCWNSDETGPGDNANGWAELFVPCGDPARSLRIEIDAWGTSALSRISIHTSKAVWTPVSPTHRLSKQPGWETLVFDIPAVAMDPTRKVQHVGFGGADSQVWIAEVRAVR